MDPSRMISTNPLTTTYIRSRSNAKAHDKKGDAGDGSCDQQQHSQLDDCERIAMEGARNERVNRAQRSVDGMKFVVIGRRGCVVSRYIDRPMSVTKQESRTPARRT